MIVGQCLVIRYGCASFARRLINYGYSFDRENAADMPEESPNRVILLTVHNPFYSINTVSHTFILCINALHNLHQMRFEENKSMEVA